MKLKTKKRIVATAVILTFAVLMSLPFVARAESAWSLEVHGFSHHLGKKPHTAQYGQREDNPGLGLRYRLDDAWSIQGGFYRNTLNRDTQYLIAQWQPLKLGALRAGVFAGYASGYLMDKPLVAGAVITLQVTPRVGVNARLVPETRQSAAALAFDLSLRF